MSQSGIRSQRATVLLLLAILILGFAVVRQGRRESRLREALAFFRNRAEQRMHARLALSYPTLAQPMLSLNWGSTSSIEDLISALRAFAARPSRGLRLGVPIEVDASGLQEAGLSLNSPMPLPPSPNGDISTDQLLHLILTPINLDYEIKDGTLVITSQTAVERSHERIRRILEQPISLSWPDGAPLEEVISKLKPFGLPIHADPTSMGADGLRELNVGPAPGKALSLREHLDHVLEPLHLKYELRNGALMIGADHGLADEEAVDGGLLQ